MKDTSIGPNMQRKGTPLFARASPISTTRPLIPENSFCGAQRHVNCYRLSTSGMQMPIVPESGRVNLASLLELISVRK